MDLLTQTLRNLLVECIEDIDSGNCKLDHDGLGEAVHALRIYSRKDVSLSKYQAYNHLGINRATFDNYIKDGKLPKGKKVPGFTELMWNEKELDEYAERLRKQKL